MALFDDIKARLTQTPEQSKSTATPEELLRIARERSGKDVTGTTTPAPSSLQYQAAVAQSEAMQQQNQLQGQLAAQQITQEQQKQQQQMQQATQQIAQQRQMGKESTDFQMKQVSSWVNQVMQKGQLSAQELAIREQQLMDNAYIELDKIENYKNLSLFKMNEEETRKIMQLQQAAKNQIADMESKYKVNEKELYSNIFMREEDLKSKQKMFEAEKLAEAQRFSDAKYIAELKRRGTESRLENELNFKEETQKILWGKELVELDKQLKFSEALATGEGELLKRLQSMSLDQKLKAAESLAEAKAFNSIVGGGGLIATSAANKFGPKG